MSDMLHFFLAHDDTEARPVLLIKLLGLLLIKIPLVFGAFQRPLLPVMIGYLVVLAFTNENLFLGHQPNEVWHSPE